MGQGMDPLAGFLGGATANDGAVNLFNVSKFEGFGKDLGTALGFRESDDTAGGGIEPLMYAQVKAGLLGQDFYQTRCFGIWGMGGEMIRFVCDQEVVVFVDDADHVENSGFDEGGACGGRRVSAQPIAA